MAAGAGGSLSPHAWTVMQLEEACAKGGLPRGDCMINVSCWRHMVARRTKGGDAGSQAHIVVVTSVPDPATLVRVQQAAERAVVVLADLEGQRTSLQAPTVQWLLKLSACHGKVGLHGVQLGSRICSPRQSPTSQCLQQNEVSGAIVLPEGDCWAWHHNPLCTSHGPVRLCVSPGPGGAC